MNPVRLPVIFPLLLPLALAACERGPREPEPPPSPTPTPSSAEPVSIIRPDIDSPREQPPLAPLHMLVRFPDGGAELDEAAMAELTTILQSPQIAAGGKIVLRGHSDPAGSDVANMRASKSRAEAVREPGLA